MLGFSPPPCPPSLAASTYGTVAIPCSAACGGVITPQVALSPTPLPPPPLVDARRRQCRGVSVALFSDEWRTSHTPGMTITPLAGLSRPWSSYHPLGGWITPLAGSSPPWRGRYPPGRVIIPPLPPPSLLDERRRQCRGVSFALFRDVWRAIHPPGRVITPLAGLSPPWRGHYPPEGVITSPLPPPPLLDAWQCSAPARAGEFSPPIASVAPSSWACAGSSPPWRGYRPPLFSSPAAASTCVGVRRALLLGHRDVTGAAGDQRGGVEPPVFSAVGHGAAATSGHE